jgi:hypothetical protein
VRGTNRQAIQRQRLHAADRMAEQLVPTRSAEAVGSGRIGDTDMDVEAVAGLVQEGLRHEGGFHALHLRDALHQPPQQGGMIRRLHRIGEVIEVDFELPHTVFRDGARSRDILCKRGLLQCGQEYRVLIERCQ